MGAKQVYAELSGSGIPFAYMAWPEGSAPALPWGVFYRTDDETFMGDDERYSEATRWCVELYQKNFDPDVESKVEEAMTAFSPFSRGYDAWIESEDCLMTVYYFTERN